MGLVGGRWGGGGSGFGRFEECPHGFDKRHPQDLDEEVDGVAAPLLGVPVPAISADDEAAVPEDPVLPAAVTPEPEATG